MSNLQPLQRPMYENCIVLAPDGGMLCRTAVRRAQWYLDRKLAEKIAEDPLTIKLTFMPGGSGDRGDEHMLSARNNACVVCGTINDLTRHHVVPFSYRHHFPPDYKNKNSYDVLPVCVYCHQKYEATVVEFRRQIEEELGVPHDMNVLNKDIIRIRVVAHGLLSYRSQMPLERQQELDAKIKEFLKKDTITDADLQGIMDIPWKKNVTGYESSSQMVVGKLPCIQSFIVRWRQHFLDTMKPQYMPPKWDVNKILCNRTVDAQ